MMSTPSTGSSAGTYTPEIIIRTVSLLSGDDANVAKEHLARLRRQAGGGTDRPVSPEEWRSSSSL